MEKIKRISIISIISIIVLTLLSSNIGAINIDHSPENPVAGSEILFKTTFDNDSLVEKVNLEISECDENIGACFTDSEQNLTMDETTNKTYETTVSLIHKDATYVQYTLLVKMNGSWISYFNNTKLDLEPPEKKKKGTDDKNGVPGFELIGIVLAAVFISTMYKRRRQK